MSVIVGGPGFHDRHPPARYIGSLPEYHGLVGCLVPAQSGDPMRSDLWVWSPVEGRQLTLRNVRRGSVESVCIDPTMKCPCGTL